MVKGNGDFINLCMHGDLSKLDTEAIKYRTRHSVSCSVSLCWACTADYVMIMQWICNAQGCWREVQLLSFSWWVELSPPKFCSAITELYCVVHIIWKDKSRKENSLQLRGLQCTQVLFCFPLTWNSLKITMVLFTRHLSWELKIAVHNASSVAPPRPGTRAICCKLLWETWSRVLIVCY